MLPSDLGVLLPRRSPTERTVNNRAFVFQGLLQSREKFRRGEPLLE